MAYLKMRNIYVSGKTLLKTVPFQQFYIDPSSLTNGIGTYNNPFNNFDYVNTINGDLQGATFYIKSNTTIRQTLSINNAHNFIITLYDGSLKPQILGSDLITGGWIADGPNWYRTGYTLNQGIHDSSGPFENVTSLVNLINNRQQFHDTVNNRLYIKYATNPNLSTFEITSRNNCVNLDQCSGFTMSNFITRYSSTNNIRALQCGDNCVFEDILTEYCGAFRNNAGQNGIFFAGLDASNKSNNSILRNIESNWNYNNHSEIWYVNNFTHEDCTGQYNTNGIEFWAAVSNASVKRAHIYNVQPRSQSNGHGNGVWIVNDTVVPGETGNHSNIRIESCVFNNTYSDGIDIGDGTGHKVFNNTLVDCATNELNFTIYLNEEGSNSTEVEVKNNNFALSGSNINMYKMVHIGNGVSADFDYNSYYNNRGFDTYTEWLVNSTFYSGSPGLTFFNNYKSGTGFDTNGRFGDPDLINITSGNFRPNPTSPLLSNGINKGVVLDKDKEIFTNPPTIGAYK